MVIYSKPSLEAFYWPPPELHHKILPIFCIFRFHLIGIQIACGSLTNRPAQPLVLDASYAMQHIARHLTLSGPPEFSPFSPRFPLPQRAGGHLNVMQLAR